MADPTIPTEAGRGDILKRLLITIACLIFLKVVRLLVQLAAVFQFLFLLAAKRHSEPLRRFCNALSGYGYRLMRYATLNDNERPFPFSRFPDDGEWEKPAQRVTFK
ncbi:DUF4389 domain-containing protein [Pseudodesulfovibrio sp. F-1]|uniref:DUF4389 domain-containing protein n=1 Tax=Pseudodesulfovibrio alkaliphilus TaxID=2661613 RepID=A0A7K1KNN3_9BACT|nr:DUF4389 domain-containing protein [Pseudodesulfovibrio alkaliphilus]MUM77705.1 DUF4389 domain-containing protein [Pseudodesulfovibrio alkaliphilus]